MSSEKVKSMEELVPNTLVEIKAKEVFWDKAWVECVEGVGPTRYDADSGDIMLFLNKEAPDAYSGFSTLYRWLHLKSNAICYCTYLEASNYEVMSTNVDLTKYDIKS